MNKKNEEAEVEEVIEEVSAKPEVEIPRAIKAFKLEKVYSAFLDVYTSWIKPVKDNWEPIKRRLNGIFTGLALVFFFIYVPLVLFGKIADGLSLGWEIALYVCIGVYAATIIALLIASLATNNSRTTEAAKKRKTVYRVIMFIVRIASLAIGITVLVITGNATQGPFTTLAMVVAIISIIFSLIPLLFGSLSGFFKWLISPEKKKYDFQFVALEWVGVLENELQTNKTIKKIVKRCGVRIKKIIDETVIPTMGKKKIKSVDAGDLERLVNLVPPEEKNLTKWVLKQIFEYSEGKYIEYNPIADVDFECEIEREIAGKGKQLDDGVKRKRFNFFKRKRTDEAVVTDAEDKK